VNPDQAVAVHLLGNLGRDHEYIATATHAAMVKRLQCDNSFHEILTKRPGQ